MTRIKRNVPRAPLTPAERKYLNRGGVGQKRRPAQSSPPRLGPFVPRPNPGKAVTPAGISRGTQMPGRVGRPEPRTGLRPPDNIAKLLAGDKRKGPYIPRGIGAGGPGTLPKPIRGALDLNRPSATPRPNPITPPGGWSNVDPIPPKGTLVNPFTDTIDGKQPAAAPPQTPKLLTPQAPAPQGPQLARPVSNAGTNGSNARYHVGPGSGLRWSDERNAWTDGVYFYDNNGLSLDRPDEYVPGLGPANESERYDPWSGRSPSAGIAPSAPPPPRTPLDALLGAGRTQPVASSDMLSQLLGGEETPPSFGGIDLPRGYEQLPAELLALIRQLMGSRQMAPPPAGSVL